MAPMSGEHLLGARLIALLIHLFHCPKSQEVAIIIQCACDLTEAGAVSCSLVV